MSPVFAPATDKAGYDFVEPGRYIATCTDIKDAPDKGFGPGVQWVFKLVDAATNQIVQDANGYDLEFWQFTSTKMSPKAKARPIIEALLGRALNDGEVPDSRNLIGKVLVGIIIHEKADDGSDRARLTSCKPYQPAGPGAVIPTATLPPRPAAGQVSADATDADVDRALLVTKLEKQIATLKKVNPEAGAAAEAAMKASDLDTAELADIQGLLDSVQSALLDS